MTHRLTATALLLGATLGITTPALAHTTHEPATKVVPCGPESCLRITGYRADISAPVAINGHAVPVSGRHRWKARVPVSEVRRWSAPYARSIAVSVENEEHSTRLPVGLLGTRGDLAMLVVSVK